MFSHIKQLIHAKFGTVPGLVEFDSAFYRNYYSDLVNMRSPRALRKHYLLHGIREGRWKNFADAKKSLESRFGQLPGDFCPATYKLLNDDLARAFSHEWQFVFHYLEHGRKEGRRYKAEMRSGPDKTMHPVPDRTMHSTQDKPWLNLFRLGDFVACAHGWLSEIPSTKEQGVRMFVDAGIERLAPLNLDHFFDPDFYRSAYGFDEGSTDAMLYRHWLETGLSQGLYANENNAIQNMIASRQYPSCFDWERYRSDLPAGDAVALRHRIYVLKHLFDIGFERGLTKHISGKQADELFVAIGNYHLIRGHHRLAITAYNRSIAANKLQSGVLHHRGDAYVALGNTVSAHADFVQAIASPHASVWSTIHAARTAVANGSFDKTFKILTEAGLKWTKSPEYRQAVRDLLEQFFAAKTKSAMALYDSGDRAVADAHMLKTLDEICARMVQLEVFPLPIPPAANGHIVILADQVLVQCKYYRVEQKLRQLQRAGLKVEAFNQYDTESFIASLIGARAAIFYRVPAFPSIARAILTAKALGIPTYYEVDDLIFNAAHYPDSFESYEGHISKAEYNGLLYGVPLYRYAMGLCEHAIASTSPLARQMEPIVENHDCLLLRNGLDERNETAIAMGFPPRPERDTISIFYGSGTKAHNSDFNELAAPALLSAFENHDTIRLYIAGHLRLRPEFDQFSSRIKHFDFTTDLDQYWSLLAASDINLAVLSPGLMADCKSEIKWLEAAVLQVPSIVSGTATYREVLEDGVDALLVEDSAAAWTNAVERLIEDRDLRRSMGLAARRKALESYSLDKAANLLQKSFGTPLRVPAKERDRGKSRIKVLICHVFFAPQSYGGATRVVQDNVEYIKNECPDIEVSVFATDMGVSPPGRTRFDQDKGIPVFRLSTPIGPHMDWRPFNTAHEDIFERILDAVQPDLVHFHCIQRLTASIVEVTLRRKIPYLVTVHDGWWISDHQFLVDQDDILRLPSADSFECMPPADIPVIDSIARRQRLASLLERAEKVIAVSDSFADIYRRAGHRNVVTMENGVSPITPAPRRRHRGDRRLSLGHIGGRSAHKGATLVEAVLRMTHFDHLKLTMIDGTMEPGARCERIWGNTPVLLCGHYPHDQVATLYASLDVLLAPSIWPESFGLVVREAQAQGLWVVASDRGAVGETIRHGENGFVIDVSDGRGLTDVLRKLDMDVARYRSAPPIDDVPARTAAHQGADLVRLYREVGAIGRSAHINVAGSWSLGRNGLQGESHVEAGGTPG